MFIYLCVCFSLLFYRDSASRLHWQSAVSIQGFDFTACFLENAFYFKEFLSVFFVFSTSPLCFAKGVCEALVLASVSSNHVYLILQLVSVLPGMVVFGVCLFTCLFACLLLCCLASQK